MIATGLSQKHTTVVRSVTPSASYVSPPEPTGTGVDWAAAADAAAPLVVAVAVSSPSGVGLGSGLIFMTADRDAYVITDDALVGVGGSIEVGFLSGEHEGGRLVGEDPLSGLALVAAPDPEHPILLPALGNSAGLRAGNPVLAIGARSAEGGSVVVGTVSGEDRAVERLGASMMQHLIAVSAPEMSGPAAGGPLLDAKGRVVGITVDIDPSGGDDQGLMFAEPIDVAEQVAQQLLGGGPVIHPWFGVSDADSGGGWGPTTSSLGSTATGSPLLERSESGSTKSDLVAG